MANAAQDALRVLADKDRVGIMVFDNYARVRMPFRGNQRDINRGLMDVLDQERFNGGTQITRAMIAAANYVQKEARPEARRAIIILTDDGSQDARDDAGVERALSRADAVLSFLEAPEIMMQRRGGMGRTGTTFPGGGGLPGLGGVIIGGGGRRYPGGGGGQVANHSAGTADIARDSGGDTFPVDDASALEETLMRLRQRYALHYNSAETSASGLQRPIQVDLTDAARRRYPDAEIRYRRVTISGNSREAGPISTTRAHAPDGGSRTVQAAASEPSNTPNNGIDEMVTPKRRRMAVDQNYGSGVNLSADDADSKTATPPAQGK
jgi:hypothetical protein